MTLIEPEQRTNDLVQSLIASQQESPFGILPVWQFAGTGDLVHDRLSLGADYRRCLS